jgi:anti-sigma factor RsiW
VTPDDARERFSAAYDGLLDEGERKAFDDAIAADEALRAEYLEFREILDGATLGPSEEAVPEVDLVKGVQSKIRSRSRGRFYRDRFSQRSGSQALMTLLLGVVVLVLLGIAWLALHFVQIEG